MLRLSVIVITYVVNIFKLSNYFPHFYFYSYQKCLYVFIVTLNNKCWIWTCEQRITINHKLVEYICCLWKKKNDELLKQENDIKIKLLKKIQFNDGVKCLKPTTYFLERIKNMEHVDLKKRIVRNKDISWFFFSITNKFNFWLRKVPEELMKLQRSTGT